MTLGERPDGPRAEIIETDGAGRPLGPIGSGSSRSLLAVVGLIAVLGLGGLFAVTNLSRPGPVAPARSSPGPSGGLVVGPGQSVPATTVSPTPTLLVVEPLDAGFPATVEGLPVESVSAALSRGPEPGGLVAVGGYLSNDRAVEGCSPAPTTDKPNPCSGTELVLVDEPAPVLLANDATFLYDIVVPAGAASIRPVILRGTGVPDPWADSTSIAARLAPRRVVLLGEFGDRRALQCAPRPGGGNAGCDRSFVIEQIAWIEGIKQGPSEFGGPGVVPVHDRSAVDQAVAGWFLPSRTPAIVSITSTLPGDAADLAGVNLEGRPNGVYWVVLVVSTTQGAPAGTYLVFDDQTMNLVEVSSGG